MTWLTRQIEHLSPACFAAVMATGIVSNACWFEHLRSASDALFAVNLLTWCCLLAATLLRIVRVPGAVWADLTDPRRVFAFFTLVAGTDVLGVGVLLRGNVAAAVSMWFCALALWLALTYLGFAVLTFVKSSQRRADIAHGGWLLAIVATESLVILGCFIAPSSGTAAATLLIGAHMLWGIGLVLYGVFIALFAQRIFFADFRPDDIGPLLWVVMGAAAICCNAGAALAGTGIEVPFISTMHGFVEAATLIAWAWASWWIPLLMLFGLWKHGLHGVPLRYEPALWALVFPLGMYALATLRLSQATGVTGLQAVAAAMTWVALAAWLSTAAGLSFASWHSYREFAGA